MKPLLSKEHRIIEKGFMEYQPFGVDENGEQIKAWDGKVIAGIIEYMTETIAQRVEEASRPAVGAEAARLAGEHAAKEALEELIERLNGAIRDKRFHVSCEYLMNEGNYYSYEFRQFMIEYASLITGDENFSFNRSYKSIRPSMVRLFRPFSLRQIYTLLPPIIGRYTDSWEIKVAETTRNSAIIQVWILEHYQKLAGPYLLSCVENDCVGLQGALSAIPPALSPDLPPASIQENKCLLWGDEYCEWEFTWKEPAPKGNGWLLLGGLLTLVAALIVAFRSRFSAGLVIEDIAFVLLPLLVGWLTKNVRSVRYEREEKEQLLMEQRQFTEEQYDELQEVNSDLQMANVELRQKISELTTVHRVGTAIASVLDLNSLLDMVLSVVTEELNFDRALVLLVDKERQVLTQGRGAGASQELIAFVGQMEIPLKENAGLLAQTVLEGQPILVTDASTLSDEADRDLVEILETKSFLAVPLEVKNEIIGVVAADNRLSTRAITEADRDILVTLGHQIGVAIENARLYRQIEAHSQILEQEVRSRTRDLVEEKTKLDVIFQNVADGLVVTDIDGLIVLANPVFETTVGQGLDALAGHSLSTVFGDQRLEKVVAGALSEVGQVLSTDVQVEARVYKASACALQVNGEASGVVTVMRDVTQEKEVDRMKTDFISMVSHELRTPLTSVLGFAKLISRTFESSVVPKLAGEDRAVQRIQDNLDIIIGEGERLTRLINDVLDIAKMEAGKVEWNETHVSVEVVIRSAVAATAALAADKGLPVRIVLEELPQVLADQDRLVQVVTNLLSNAIKFTDEGEIVVSGSRLSAADAVKALRSFGVLDAGPQDWLVVKVTDTGLGISPEHLGQVFERFKQVGDTLTGRPKGTGLGLPICKEIIEHHGGHIWAESELGNGSTLTFVLPLTGAAVSRPPVLSEIRRRVVETLPDEEVGQLILVVDDEENIRNLLRQELTEAGYRVIEAVDGVEAVAKARKERPNLIILDVMMPPGISGFDVTSVLKADEVTADIPILILSILEDREKGFRIGADEYLTKPLDTGQLRQSVATLLAHAKYGGGGKKVLVIDRDTTVVEMIARVLQERGYVVVEATSGEEGLEKVRQERPDLIILDAVISRVDDYKLLKLLKFETEGQDARIIVLTAAALPEKISQVLEQETKAS